MSKDDDRVGTHVPSAALAAYATGDPGLDDVAAWGVEAHLDTCARCRARLADHAAPPVRDLLGTARTALLHEARTGPQPAPARSRWRRWTGWSPLGWAVTALTAVLAAFLLDRAYPQFPSVVLLLAPLAPISGLAVAWSRRTDPAWETLAGMPRAGLELVLRRTLVVLAATLPALTVAGLLLGESPALWLLPAITGTSATLWLGGRIGVTRAAAALATAWIAAVIVPAVLTMDVPPMIRAEGVPGWAAAAVICTVLALLRADGFLRLHSWR
ncbi:FtsH-binding integral membrane protein [Catenuloplanes nepalensis]|uniref:FtsH-binding integral membrane protein n=1 Tax=Catenuloplanes nepalensis TaxID=587533 RepID=A0ABT9MRC8_9ACTN|nr:zf-HC2 domain-containing protein [Catenuloplanes nepalensis]MDP9794002.1 FtsH-binding integral membrane protein [Catenuloplanes nepalensis]